MHQHSYSVQAKDNLVKLCANLLLRINNWFIGNNNRKNCDVEIYKILYNNVLALSTKGCLQKKTVKFGTLAQKEGGGQASIPNFFHILIGTNTVGGRGSKGPCHKIIQ